MNCEIKSGISIKWNSIQPPKGTSDWSCYNMDGPQNNDTKGHLDSSVG